MGLGGGLAHWHLAFSVMRLAFSVLAHWRISTATRYEKSSIEKFPLLFKEGVPEGRGGFQLIPQPLLCFAKKGSLYSVQILAPLLY